MVLLMAALVAMPSIAQKKRNYMYEASRHLDTTGYYYYETKRNSENKLSDMVEVIITNRQGEALAVPFWLIMGDGDTVKLSTNAEGLTEIPYSLFRKMSAFCCPATLDYKTLKGRNMRHTEYKKGNNEVPAQLLSLRLVLYHNGERVEMGCPYDFDFSEYSLLYCNHRLSAAEMLELMQDVIEAKRVSPLWKEAEAKQLIEI